MAGAISLLGVEKMLRVSAWKGGKFGARCGRTLGVRIGSENAEKYFDKKWKVAMLELDGIPVAVRITRTFWTSCPELRSEYIGDWLRRRGLAPWPKGKPPRMVLKPLGGNRFRLEL